MLGLGKVINLKVINVTVINVVGLVLLLLPVAPPWLINVLQLLMVILLWMIRVLQMDPFVLNVL